jgi:hypothetical protein
MQAGDSSSPERVIPQVLPLEHSPECGSCNGLSNATRGILHFADKERDDVKKGKWSFRGMNYWSGLENANHSWVEKTIWQWRHECHGWVVWLCIIVLQRRYHSTELQRCSGLFIRWKITYLYPLLRGQNVRENFEYLEMTAIKGCTHEEI